MNFRLVYDVILLLVLGWVGLLSSIKDVAEVGSSNVIEMEPGNLLELSLRSKHSYRVIALGDNQVK